jgi:hypothetical protein|tara:strand:+ start:162 stop:686 length:525 start_codon:yes stop_codon:yes gene_type:complete
MALDKVTPLAAPPGHSLTGTPGQWPWERPPLLSDPNDAVDYVIERLETGGGDEDMVKLMLAGVTIQELVSQISFKGFMAGTFNPDVAELIKPAMAVYLMGLAEENGVEPELFVVEPEKERENVDDQTLFRIMKQRNPSLYAGMIESMNEDLRMSREKKTAPPPPPAEPSFLSSE